MKCLGVLSVVKPSNSVTTEEVERQAILKHYELGIEDCPVKDKDVKQILLEEQRRLGRDLTIDEKITALKEEYQRLRSLSIIVLQLWYWISSLVSPSCENILDAPYTP